MYTLREIQGVMEMLQPSQEIGALRAVLGREEGTRRIARGLRLLGRVNRAALRDLIDRLDVVRDPVMLTRVIADVAQECEMAAARTEFMLVPNEDDVTYLLEDVAQFGASMIATLLILLSAVRYPKSDTQDTLDRQEEEGEAHGS